MIRAIPAAVVRFVESAYKRPVWILASVGFCSGLAYMFAFESTQPEQIAAIKRTLEEARVYEEDFETLYNHSQRMVSARSDHLKILNARIDILNDILAKRTVSVKARESYDNTLQLRSELISFNNKAKAITLRFPNSEPFAQQLQRDESDILRILDQLGMFEVEFRALMNEDLMHMSGEPGDPVAILMAASFVRDDLPWLYELAMEVYRAVKEGNAEAIEREMTRLRHFSEAMMRGPFMEEFGFGGKESHMFAMEFPRMLEHHVDAHPRNQEEAHSAQNAETATGAGGE